MINYRIYPARNKRYLLLFILTFGLMGSFSVANPARSRAEAPATGNEEMTTVQESKPLVARTGAWQIYNDHIHIKPGQERRTLLLTFINGAGGREKLTDLRVELARKPFVTIKDFNASGTLSRNLTGTIGAGNSLLTVHVFGPSGARLVWRLSTQKPKVTAVNPNPFTLADKVTVRGINFSEQAQASKVFVAGKPAKVLSAQGTALQLKLPTDLPGGKHDLVVVVDSVKSNVFKVTARANPQVTWVDFVATAPGQPLVISGKGFSRVASENSVTFGSIKARVVSATETSITCIVPEMQFPKWHVPITVTSNGMPSKGRVTINIDVRVIPNEGFPQL